MKRSRSGLCVLVAGLLVVAACGDDDDGEATDTTATAATDSGAATTSAGAGTTSGGAVTTAAPEAADESLPPVLVGFHNLEGGAVSLPEVRIGFEEGIKYVNEELGGINGQTVEIESCNLDITPESSVNCANQVVEADVVAAIQGVDVAADAALPVLKEAGIAEIALAAFSPGVDVAVGDAFVLLWSSREGLAADLIAMQNLEAERVAMLFLDVPAAHAYETEVTAPVAEQLGIDLETFYYQNQTDWTTFAATVLASNPDAVSFPSAEEQVCLGAVPAIRAAGFTGVIHASSCAQIIDELDASQLENVVNHNEFYYPTMTEVPPKPQADIDVFLRYMERDYPDYESLVYTMIGFHTAVVASDMIRQTPGEITAESVKAALPNASGPSFFREQGYDCANPAWPDTSACGSGVIFTEVTPDKRKEVLPFSPVDVSEVRPA